MYFVRKHSKMALLVIAVCAVLGAVSLYYVKTSQSALAVGLRRFAGDFLHNSKLPSRPNPRDGLRITNETLYVNNIPAAAFQRGQDNKLVLETADFTRLFDYANGFSLDLPTGVAFDFTKSPSYVTVSGAGFEGVVSKEWSVDTDVSAYVAYYFNRFVLDERFQQENRVTLLTDTKTDAVEVLTVRVADFEGYDTYTYMVFKSSGRFFYRVMLKYNHDNAQMPSIIDRVVQSFAFFKPTGQTAFTVDYYPVLPENWTPETVALYDRFMNPDHFLWGVFVRDVTGTGIDSTIPALEASLAHRFGMILAYVHLTDAFPTAFMQRCYDEGRVVELTYQLTRSNNLDLTGRSPVLAMRSGEYDDAIRAFAREAKAFGHPFLFRLNNEMNSDWTSYGGVVNLLDPDIFVENWRLIYRIFDEEGVDNAIWIFNPNGSDCPPNRWNSFVAYYPGNEYVHMLGLTGYNTGTYYRDTFGETWREFDWIFDEIVSKYDGMFDRFPWIITEFASSSIGGNKAQWIDRMFKTLRKEKYPRLTAAVWFSFADYDFRPEQADTVARPYWLDETPDTLAAFKRGLDRLANP